ncbi:Cupin 1 [Dillenia turbinata]|uniref:Germin-like protein n=1 Tax=Dillenia turbinata TaxID=194707 RepID=A0AAN8VG02_9MAGN
MLSKSKRAFFLFLMVLTIFYLETVDAGDPNILSDFNLPANVTTVNGTFFKYSILQGLEGSPQTFQAVKASLKEFPALDGQSVSMAVLKFPPGSINPLHTHPRAAELLFLHSGTLEVGFVDTKNGLFNQTLKPGDMFVFPKGIVHYQYNRNHKEEAMAISSFGSASAGTQSVPMSVFNEGISDKILAKAFKTDIDTIRKIKAGIAKLRS